MRTKPQDDLLKAATDQSKALDDYAAGLKKLETMNFDSTALEKYKKDGVSALDTINAVLAMTPEQFEEYNNTLKDIATKTAKMAEEEFAAEVEKTKEALKGITAVITEYAESDEFKEASEGLGTATVDNEIKGIKEKQEELNNAATTAIEDAATAMRNIVDGGAFKSIGLRIAEGIASGITAGTNAVVNAAVGMLQSAMTSMQGFSQIQSPSKLFRDKIGKNIALGIGVGIRDEVPSVVDELRRLNQMAVNAANQTMTLRPTASDVFSSMNRSNMANMAEIKHMLRVQLDNSNRQQSQQSQPQYLLEANGSLRDVFTAIGVELRRVDNLNGGAKA